VVVSSIPGICKVGRFFFFEGIGFWDCYWAWAQLKILEKKKRKCDGLGLETKERRMR